MFLLSLVLVYSISSLAHCPNNFKYEHVCFMLDQNLLYIYDHKGEHNGPYKDLSKYKITNMTFNGNQLSFKRIARGVFKLENKENLKKIEVEMSNDKMKTVLNVYGE